MQCNIHGIELVQRPGGTSKTTGKPYPSFWACPAKNPDGSFCRFKPPATTNVRVEMELEKDQTQARIDKRVQQKDNNILKSVALKAAVDSCGIGQDVGDVLDRADTYLKWLEE